MRFPSLSSNIILIGTHHILDRDISEIVAPFLENAGTVVLEHQLIIGENEELPRVQESIDNEKTLIIENILDDLGWPCTIGHLRIDEAVSLVQRSAFSSLGELFFPDAWAERYARDSGKEIHYAETVEERDAAVREFYINYLSSLSGKDALLNGIKESLQNYWTGIINVDENISGERFYRDGVTERSISLLEQLVFELVRRDNIAVAFFGAIHCMEIVEWLGGGSRMDGMEINLSSRVLEKIAVTRT